VQPAVHLGEGLQGQAEVGCVPPGRVGGGYGACMLKFDRCMYVRSVLFSHLIVNVAWVAE
jgi:hypothetical protein